MGRVTINDVAAAAGVSIKTVSRVLNREPYVGAATRTRVEAAVATLALPPVSSGRARAGGRAVAPDRAALRQSVRLVHPSDAARRARSLRGGGDVRMIAQPYDRRAGPRARRGRGAGRDDACRRPRPDAAGQRRRGGARPAGGARRALRRVSSPASAPSCRPRSSSTTRARPATVVGHLLAHGHRLASRWSAATPPSPPARDDVRAIEAALAAKRGSSRPPSWIHAGRLLACRRCRRRRGAADAARAADRDLCRQ